MQTTPEALFNHGLNAIGWRLRRVLSDQRVDRTLVKAAGQWRLALKKPVFIGITGSAGKTTTKELLLGVLSGKSPVVANPASLNVLPEVAKTILRVRPGTAYCVAELSEDRPGVMDDKLALLQPSIAIVTMAMDDHLAAFDSRDALLGEMGKLVAALPNRGTAVLNADDERVLSMTSQCVAKIITFGTSPKADLRAEDISSVWPSRLQLTLAHGSERVTLVTQLCGTHWIPSVLGAIGGGLATGMTLAACATGTATVAPFEGRMQPVTTPEGVTFIRDDFKAPLWTLDACFEFIKNAKANRKIIVIGEISDIGPTKALKYTRIASQAQEIADLVIFIGPWASSVLKARIPGREDALRIFSHVRDASEFINSISRQGDLVLLKGTNKQDHLLRILLAHAQGVACWRDDCERQIFCNECPERMKPSGAPLLNRQKEASPFAPGAVDAHEQVIVGLGNPGAPYTNTPHNVGYKVVDQLATSLGLTWNESPGAWTARGSTKGRLVCLVKIQSVMNLSGAGLKHLAEAMGFSPEQCILVFDDLDLPLGTVRTRQDGSAGGHRGVASILEAFQTDAFRRVKVGVAPATATVNRLEYVLRPFDAVSQQTVAQAILSAEARVLDMAPKNNQTSNRIGT
jgi:UDP-N-acetylmuramoyl-tripeptide--D-alanyl-D-alanine ligase